MSTNPHATPGPDDNNPGGEPDGTRDGDGPREDALGEGFFSDDTEAGDDLDIDGVDPKHLAPLVVDPSDLHARISELTAALHRYVDLAVGARAEFDAATVEDDPRIEAAEDEIGRINAAISEAFETQLGLISGHTTEMWESDDLDETDAGDELSTLVELTFTVSPGPLTTDDDPFDRAVEIVEGAAAQVADALEDAGYTVDAWSVSRDIDLDLGDED